MSKFSHDAAADDAKYLDVFFENSQANNHFYPNCYSWVVRLIYVNQCYYSFQVYQWHSCNFSSPNLGDLNGG